MWGEQEQNLKRPGDVAKRELNSTYPHRATTGTSGSITFLFFYGLPPKGPRLLHLIYVHILYRNERNQGYGEKLWGKQYGTCYWGKIQHQLGQLHLDSSWARDHINGAHFVFCITGIFSFVQDYGTESYSVRTHIVRMMTTIEVKMKMEMMMTMTMTMTMMMR